MKDITELSRILHHCKQCLIASKIDLEVANELLATKGLTHITTFNDTIRTIQKTITEINKLND